MNSQRWNLSRVLLWTALLSVVFHATSVAETEFCGSTGVKDSVSQEESCLDDVNATTAASSTKDQPPPCRLYLAESNGGGGLSVYSAVDLAPDATVGEPDILVPFIDPNVNDKSSSSRWQEHFWPAYGTAPEIPFEGEFHVRVFAPSNTQCAHETDDAANVKICAAVDQSSTGVHRSDHATAGSFSYYHNVTTCTTKHVKAGEELLMDCPGNRKIPTNVGSKARPVQRKSLEWLTENGQCIDNLHADNSTIPSTGRGAFATRFLPKGSTVSPALVIPMHRRDLLITEQDIDDKNRDHVIYRINQTGQQLLRNYVIGHPNSDVVLLPSAPLANFINHDRSRANVRLQWSPKTNVTQMSLYELLTTDQTLLIDYVATRDIEPGDEIFLDYGAEWEAEMTRHLSEWETNSTTKDYVSAREFEKQQANESIRTIAEQRDMPYPDNIRTAMFWDDEASVADNLWGTPWKQQANAECLRPCSVLGRYPSKEHGEVYRVKVWPMDVLRFPLSCRLHEDDTVVAGVPRRNIRFVDEYYSTDMHMQSAFRDEIGAPPGMFPEQWMVGYRPKRHGKEVGLATHAIETGEISSFKIAHTGNATSDNAFRIGLPPGFTQAIKAFCKRMGFLAKARSFVVDGNPLDQDDHDVEFSLAGYKWLATRPRSLSNLHLLGPANKEALDEVLRVIGESGFDHVLERLGNHLNLDSLFCYHVSLMAVSEQYEDLYLGHDGESGNSTMFELLIPLTLFDNSSKIVLWNDENSVFGEYHFEEDVAVIFGDNVEYGLTVDRLRNKDNLCFVLSVSIDTNLEGPKLHWKRGDPSKKLPGPLKSDFVLRPLKAGELEPLIWADTNEVPTQYAFRLGLKPELTKGIQDYAERMGITAKARSFLVGGNELPVYEHEFFTLQGYNWYIRRPSHNGNIHWMNPNDEKAHDEFLRMLGSSGFDDVLSAIGTKFGLRLQAYHLSFLAVSQCDESYMHGDFWGAEGKLFNVIIPVVLVDGSKPELNVADTRPDSKWGEYTKKGALPYQYDVATVVGDETYHGSAPVDYRFTDEFRLVASVYIGEVTKGNVEDLIDMITQPYPYQGEDYFFANQGIHFDPNDPTKRLPRYDDE